MADSKFSSNNRSEASEVNGYIHEVSEVLIGKQGNRYFDFKVQENATNFTRIACFSPDKRNTLKKKEESKKAVLLLNLSPNKRRYDPENKEYTMNKYYKVTDGRSLSFPWKSVPPSNNLVSVRDVLDGVASPNGELISVKVKVHFVSTTETVYSSTFKKHLRKCDAVIVDNKSSIRLTVWEQLIEKIEVGKCYLLSNVKASFYNSIFLNTTKKTTITALEENIEVSAEAIQNADDLIVRESGTQLEGEILCAEASHSFVCINCNHRIQESEEKEFVKCPSCHVTSLKRKLPTSVTAKVLIEDNGGNCERYHCPMAVLRPFFSNLAKTEGYGIKDSDVTKLSDEIAAQTLLQTGKLKFEVNTKEKKLESMQIVQTDILE